MTADMRVLCLMAVAADLWDTACDDYSECEDQALILARLEMHAHALNLITDTISKETR